MQALARKAAREAEAGKAAAEVTLAQERRNAARGVVAACETAAAAAALFNEQAAAAAAGATAEYQGTWAAYDRASQALSAAIVNEDRAALNVIGWDAARALTDVEATRARVRSAAVTSPVGAGRESVKAAAAAFSGARSRAWRANEVAAAARGLVAAADSLAAEARTAVQLLTAPLGAEPPTASR